MGISQQIALQEKLRTIESSVNSAFSSGNYRLSVYLENFACNLFEIYYGYSFINLNETKTNNEGVDIFNEQYNHGIQVTNETPSSKKIDKTIALSGRYKKVDVFFFTTRTAKQLKKKYESNEFGVTTLNDIMNDAAKYPVKCGKYNALIDLWFFENANVDIDIATVFNDFSYLQFAENVSSKKYNKDLYVEEPILKNICRFIAIKGFGNEFFFKNAQRYFANPFFAKLLNTKAVGNEETLVFSDEVKGYEMFLKELNSTNPLVEKQVFSKYFNYLSKCYGWGINKSYQVKEVSSERVLDYFEIHNNRVFIAMADTNNYLSAIDKRIAFIVRDACKGKTCFLSNFFETVLKPRSIPTLYVNIKDVPNSLTEYIKNSITNLLGTSNFYSAANLLKQYLESSNKRISLLLDGLNESSDLSTIKKEIMHIFKYVQINTEVSLVMTVRPTIFDNYYKNDAYKISPYKDLVYASDDRELTAKVRDIHNELLFDKYMKYYNVNCNISYAVKQMLMDNPLMLSLFSQLYEGDSKSIVKNLMTKRLFDKYFNDRGEKYVQSGIIDYKGDYMQFAVEMAELMLNKGNIYQIAFSDIPLTKKRILKYLLDNDILFSENSGDFNSTYSFTFDEIRDYCFSKFILKKPDFVNYLNALPASINEDTKIKIARFVFLELKENKDINRYNDFKKFTNFNEVYCLNLLSLDSSLWDADDIENIKKSILSFYGGTYEYLAYRLEYDDTAPCAYDLVSSYLNMNLADKMEWEKMFLGEYRFYNSMMLFESTLFYKLLKMKSERIEENEIEALLWIGVCLFHRLSKAPNQCDIAERLFKKIYKEHTENYLKAVESINKKRPEFAYTTFLHFDIED